MALIGNKILSFCGVISNNHTKLRRYNFFLCSYLFYSMDTIYILYTEFLNIIFTDHITISG